MFTQAAWKSCPHLVQRTLASPTQETSHSGQMPATMAQRFARYGCLPPLLEGACKFLRLASASAKIGFRGQVVVLRLDPALTQPISRLARAAAENLMLLGCLVSYRTLARFLVLEIKEID